MVEAVVKVRNKIGLHARPVSVLVTQAGKFKSVMTIKKGEKEVNLKSLMGVLSLGVCGGEEVTIRAQGDDEKEALESTVSFIENLED